MSEVTTNRRVSLDMEPWQKAREDFLADLSTRLDHGLGGLAAAGELADWLDTQVLRLRDALSEIVPAVPMAVYATGSYGRGWLAPASDVDLLAVYRADSVSPGELAEVLGALQTALRDAGYRVGLAARTPDECLHYASEDLTIAASMFDARLLYGGDELGDMPFGEAAGLSDWIVDLVRSEGGGRPFASRVRQGCTERHERYGRTVYRLEPNIKRGRGGLRDVQALLWSARVLHGARNLDEVGEVAGIDDATKELFRDAADFVFKARIRLHLEAGRFANDRMTFALQERIAARLAKDGDADRLLPVERFMQRYYRAAETVASDALAWLDIWLLPEPEARPLSVSAGICLRQGHLDLVRADDRMDRDAVLPVAGQTEIGEEQAATRGTSAEGLSRRAVDVLRTNPVRLHELAMGLNKPIHPVAYAHLKRAAAALSPEQAAEREITGSLVRVLTAVDAPFRVLRSLADSGLFFVILPEFEPVRALAQHDVYHEFTVDAHLLRALEELKALLRGDGDSSGHRRRFIELGAAVPGHRHRALLLAGLLHDVGKGRGGDHSEIGAQLAGNVGPRLGLSHVETGRLGFLIRHHLLLSKVSQRRDLTDRKVIEDVARTVGNLHALEDLALLTVADMSAVGPGRFTEWKAQLLAEIVDRVATVFAEGLDAQWPLLEARQAIAVAASAALMARGDGGSADGLDAFLSALPHRYLLNSTPERIVDHFRLFANDTSVSVHFASDTDEHFTELAVFTDDRPGTLLTIAGVLSASSVNILTAEIVTSPSARTLDVFRVQTATGTPLNDEGKRARLTEALTDALTGETDVAELIRGRRADVHSGPALPTVPTVVSIDQRSSDRYTVVEIKTRDRIGLLWEIASALFSKGCSVAVSRIVTEGIRVIDVFYVEHAAESRKLTDPEASALGKSLSAALAGMGRQ